MGKLLSSWDFKLGNLLSGSFSGSEIIFTPNGRQLLLPVGNRLTIFDVARGESTMHRVEHRASITHAVMSPDGKYILTADKDHTVIISEKDSFSPCYSRRFKREITAVAFGATGFSIAFSNKLLTFRHVEETSAIEPFVVEERLGGHYSSITSIHYSPDGTAFATCSTDLTIRLFKDDYESVVLSGHRGNPLFVKFSDDSKFVTTIGADGTVFHFDITEYPKLVSKRRLDETSFETHGKHRFKRILCAAMSQDALVCGYGDGSFRIYGIQSSVAPIITSFTVSFSSSRVTSVAISQQYAAIVSQNLEIVVWDLSTNTVVQRSQSHAGGVATFAYSPNGVVVATGGDDWKVKIWDTRTGVCLMTFDEHKGPVTSVVFGENGRTVLSCSTDGTILAFDVVNGRKFRQFQPPNEIEYTHIATDSQLEFVAATSNTYTIHLYSVMSGHLVEELTGHDGPVTSICFTGDSKLVSGSIDGTVRIWDFLGAQTSQAIEAQGEATAVAVSPDSKILVIANSRGRLIFYRLDELEYIGEIECSADIAAGKKFANRKAENTQWYFDSIDFSPDGKFIVCGGRSKHILIYNVDRQVLVKRIAHTRNREYLGIEKYTPKSKVDFILQSTLENRPQIEAAVREIRWCPTGRGIAAATPEGLLIYVISSEEYFDPFELEEGGTPAAVTARLQNKEYLGAILGAIRLGKSEWALLKTAVLMTPIDQIEFIALHLPIRFVTELLSFLADMLQQSQEVEVAVLWTLMVLRHHSSKLRGNALAVAASHLLQRSFTSRLEQPKMVAKGNLDMLRYLCSQPVQESSSEEDGSEL